jgi:hypothetical protein
MLKHTIISPEEYEEFDCSVWGFCARITPHGPTYTPPKLRISPEDYEEFEGTICSASMTDSAGSMYSDPASELPMFRLNPKDGRCERLNRRGEWARGIASGLVHVTFDEKTE